MATKKDVEVKETAVMEDVKAVDPWKDMKEIFIPKAPKGEDNFIIASVNGRIFKVMRGVKVEVPAPIAEVIEHSMEASAAADEFIEKASNE